MFPVIARIHYYDACTEKIAEENRIFYANDLIDAAQVIEDYYGEAVDQVSFEFLEEGWLFKISDEAIEEIRKELA